MHEHQIICYCNEVNILFCLAGICASWHGTPYSYEKFTKTGNTALLFPFFCVTSIGIQYQFWRQSRISRSNNSDAKERNYGKFVDLLPMGTGKHFAAFEKN